MFIICHKTIWNVNVSVFSEWTLSQASSQDPGRAPLLLSAECQRSGTVTRVSLDYHCCPATAPSTQLTTVQVLLPLDHTATDLQCQPPASWWELEHIHNTILGVSVKRTLRSGWLLIEMERKEKMKWICDERSDRWRELCYWLVLFHRSAEERRLLWKLPNLSPTNHSKGHCCHLFILSFLFLSLIHDSCLTLYPLPLKK